MKTRVKPYPCTHNAYRLAKIDLVGVPWYQQMKDYRQVNEYVPMPTKGLFADAIWKIARSLVGRGRSWLFVKLLAKSIRCTYFFLSVYTVSEKGKYTEK